MPSTKNRSKKSFRVVRTASIAISVLNLVLASVWSGAAVQAADSNVNVQVCPSSPYPAPMVTSPEDSSTTTESSLLLSGTAVPGVVLYVYRNDTQVGFVSAGGDGSFAIGVSLVMGTNALKASSNNDCSAPAFSNIVTVTRQAVQQPPDPDPSPDPSPDDQTEEIPIVPPEPGDEADTPGTADRPKTPAKETPDASQAGKGSAPVILHPKDGARVLEPFVMLIGEAAPNTLVRIFRNGQQVAQVTSDDKGQFVVRINLDEGGNKLFVTTGKGNDVRKSKEVLVVYAPPMPGISLVKVVALAAAAITLGVFLYILLIKLGLLRIPRCLKRRSRNQ